MLDSQIIMQNWLDETIIGLNLCPFAKKKREKTQITQFDLLSSELFNEIEKYIHKIEKEEITTVVFYQEQEIEFETLCLFNQEIQNKILKKKHNYQVIAFHPDFSFEKTQKQDRINLVNKSPYPAIHLLSNAQVDEVQKKESLGIDINKSNEIFLKSLSQDQIDAYFKYLKDRN